MTNKRPSLYLAILNETSSCTATAHILIENMSFKLIGTNVTAKHATDILIQTKQTRMAEDLKLSLSA